jgi:hypothetical protein
LVGSDTKFSLVLVHELKVAGISLPPHI